MCALYVLSVPGVVRWPLTALCVLCLCPQWFHSAADAGEGASGITSSKFRADWAFRQRDFEVFPGLAGTGEIAEMQSGAVLQSPMCSARVNVHYVPRPAGLAAVPRLIPPQVRADRAAPSRAGPRSGSAFCHDPSGSQPAANRAGARLCPGTDRRQAGAPQQLRRSKRGGLRPCSESGVWVS